VFFLLEHKSKVLKGRDTCWGKEPQFTQPLEQDQEYLIRVRVNGVKDDKPVYLIASKSK